MPINELDIQTSLEDFSRSLDHAHLTYQLQAYTRLALMSPNNCTRSLDQDIEQLRDELRRFNRRYRNYGN